jgi:hypothetical protein
VDKSADGQPEREDRQSQQSRARTTETRPATRTHVAPTHSAQRNVLVEVAFHRRKSTGHALSARLHWGHAPPVPSRP